MLFTWADFLINSLPDPGKQLCTDDFEVGDRFGFEQNTGFSEDGNKQYLRAWSCMGWCGSWMKTFLQLLCADDSVCRGRIHTMWTWHLACTHFYVSAWWQGWVDQSWFDFLLLWARDDWLLECFTCPEKQGKYKRNLVWHPLRVHPLRGIWYCGVIQSMLSGKQVEYPAISY